MSSKRNRVLSFMSNLSNKQFEHRESRPAEQAQPYGSNAAVAEKNVAPAGVKESPTQRQRSNTAGRERSNSRPGSMIGGYIPPVMDIAPDTIPELFPIFTLLNSHSNKLYQEGYFLKLNDLDVHGKPYSDRSWTECFAQLVGTVLSLWDAAALDAAGEDGEVAPSFINLADASIRMMTSLQTGSSNQALQNVLSISTAGKNRYLLHFSSHHVLTQWTAAIRLAMFENTCLQEAYTGSLIAGKGKTLNSIKQLLTRTVFATEEWTRVRFGAGTPWRRCWCVISPPDPKRVKQETKAAKKTSAYSRSSPIIKGDIKFYDTHKVTKKTRPVATINDAYSTYAVYPQSRALIDQSTLIKIEGTITIHSSPEITTEGFVFVMPEVHPAVSGFEMMLRFLFPIYDIFHLYGRPNRLIADTLDSRGLMFALPQEKRYGYLDLFDVAAAVNKEGSGKWSEQEWRKKMKNLVSENVSKARENAAAGRSDSRQMQRNSLPGRGSLRFADSDSMRSDPSLNRNSNAFGPPRTDSAPPGDGIIFGAQPRHGRSASENISPTRAQYQAGGPYGPSRLSQDYHDEQTSFNDQPPPPPVHGNTAPPYDDPYHTNHDEELYARSSSEGELYAEAPHQALPPPPALPSVGGPEAPVSPPPAFTHQPGSRPGTAPRVAPDLRRANSRMSSTTLSQLAAANKSQVSNGQELSRDMVNQDLGDRPETATETYAQHQGSTPYTFDDSNPRPPSLGYQGNVSSHSSTSTLQATTHAEGLHLDTAAIPPNLRRSPLGQSPVMISPESPVSRTSHSSPNLPLSPTVPAVIQPEPIPQSPPGPERRTSNVLRKPLPKSATSALASSPSSVNKSIRRKAITSNPPPPKQPASMNDTVSEADTNSTTDYSSSYAESTRSPNAARGPITLPTGQQIPNRDSMIRTGVLRVAGGTSADREVTIGDAKYAHEGDPNAVKVDLPDFDFGPTLVYSPGIPGRTANARPKSSANPFSLSQENLLNFNASHDSRPGTAPDLDANRRSMAWQPANSPRPEGGVDTGLTPEEFVAQRNIPGRATPVYAPARQQSTTPPQQDGRKRLSKNPPSHIQQRKSGDWSTQHPVSNQQPPSRPHSRGASTVLSPPADTPDYSRRLTAREQEHVARVTNTPLINLASLPHKRQESSGGLVSAIAAREQEKAAMKAGYGGQMVQQAIAQRSQAVQQQQTHQLYDRRPSPGMQMPYAGLPQGGLGPGYAQSIPQGYQMEYVQAGPAGTGSMPYNRQQQAYFQDAYVQDGAYRAHSPNPAAQRASPAYSPGQNRMSYAGARTPSPNVRGHKPADSHDSYFRQG